MVSPENLRNVMRNWTTGVCIVSCSYEDQLHGMTVNSFTSVSLDPPIVSLTLANNTRTFGLIQKAGKFSISILKFDQKWISDRFAGKVPESSNRYANLDTISMPGGQIAIANSIACLECSVRKFVNMHTSTLILGDVENTIEDKINKPLVYHNRGYYTL